MARISQLSPWIVLLVLVAALVAAVSPSALAVEEASLLEKSEEATDEPPAAEAANAKRSWTDWATDSFSTVQKQGKEAAAQTFDSAKTYASQGSQKILSSKDQIQESAGGLFKKWGGWARDAAAKYNIGKFSWSAKDGESQVTVDQEITSAEEEL